MSRNGSTLLRTFVNHVNVTNMHQETFRFLTITL